MQMGIQIQTSQNVRLDWLPEGFHNISESTTSVHSSQH